MTTTTVSGRSAIVIGGSLGGLFAGTLLRRAGWNVEIFERSEHDLDSRGGGIVLRPEVADILARVGADIGEMDLGVRSTHRTVLAQDGTVLRKDHAPQVQTSWSLIYSTMRAQFGTRGYHHGKRMVEIAQDEGTGSVTAVFADGTRAMGDLLIGADGHGSSVRDLLWPDAQPRYAGYLAWRGLVPELELPPISRAQLHGDFGFANAAQSHMLGYLVPGEENDTRPGHRLYNWVWYRAADHHLLDRIMTDKHGRSRGFSVPEGALDPRWRAHLVEEAATILPPAFRELVRATAEPFAQAIRDLRVDRMVKGRVALVGDAAFIPRPHTAAGSSKAATNAMTLADALRDAPDDIDAALKSWEPAQLALGRRLFRQGTETGDYLLFGRGRAAKIG